MVIFLFRNMLDRYVNDEFRSADKDFSNGKYQYVFISLDYGSLMAQFGSAPTLLLVTEYLYTLLHNN